METPIRILGIAGNVRRGSYNRATLRAATELAPKGVTVETFELDGIPPFDQGEERNPPAKVAELKRRLREANAILFVTPEYNWSMSGVLKNAIDWAPTALRRRSTSSLAAVTCSATIVPHRWARAASLYWRRTCGTICAIPEPCLCWPSPFSREKR